MPIVNKSQAVAAGEANGTVFHYCPTAECNQTIWRSNGHCKTWVSRPLDFKLPIKRGLSHYGYINQHNATDFHLASDCPLLDDSTAIVANEIDRQHDLLNRPPQNDIVNHDARFHRGDS